MPNALESAVPVVCWSCHSVQDEPSLFCPHCNKIQPASASDFFHVFGLKRAFAIDLEPLEREFHRLSRKLHPDRFARSSEQEREWSLANTALVNDAYRTLKDPLTRTEYLLKLEGAEIGEQHAGKNRQDPSRVPPDLLEEVFELNMQLEEMRAAKKTGETDSQLQADLQTAKKKFDGLLEEVDRDLRNQWKVWDEGDAAAREAAKTAMVKLLDRRRYLRNLVRDVTETLGD